jgi:hypothetical protein
MNTMHKLLIALSCCTALIATGCAVDGQNNDDFTNFNSELVTPQEYAFSVRPATDDSTPKMDDLASDVAQNNSQNLDLNDFQAQADAANSCASNCRDEADSAARECQQFAGNPEDCVVESRDVFTTCFDNDCKNFGMDANDELNPEEDFSAKQDAAPEMTCEQKCRTRYQDSYLECLQSPTSDVDQCRDEAETGIDACFNAHCVEVPELEAPTQPEEIEVDVVELCESACKTDAKDLFHECMGEAHADVLSCRAHAIAWEGTCVELHCPKS